jgi:endonuclease/exonuclease/phosphatase family metal-dependent hydrolase
VTAWRDFPWGDRQPGPLCTDGRSPTDIDCRIEGFDYTDGVRDPGDELVICAYNAERGRRLDEQLRAFSSGGGMPPPDVLLLSEADRGCTRSGERNVAREYAETLRMRSVYGVEFVELPRVWGFGGRIRRRCEHGNAIVSRLPLGNVRTIRHPRARSWSGLVQRSLHVGQPRLGGRVAVVADARVGERLVRLYAVHFESGRPGDGRWGRDRYRRAQAQDLIDDAADVGYGVVIGGDMNVLDHLRADDDDTPSEPTVRALSDAGYRDAHAAIAMPDRATTDTGRTIDLVVGRGVRFVDAGIGPRDVWGGLSDHLPVWARLRLDDERGAQP